MQEKLRDLYRELYRGMIEKDRPALDRILHDDCAIVHMTGAVQSKREFIDGVTGGELNYYSQSGEDITVSPTEKGARVVGRSKVLAAVFGGGKHFWRLLLKLDCVLVDDEWRIVKAVASTY